MNLLGKTVKRIDTTPNVSIIAVIGSGMKGTVGTVSYTHLTLPTILLV